MRSPLGTRQWQRHRSAPAGALFAAAFTLVTAVSCSLVLAVATQRAARGLPAATVGLPRGSFERPSPARAVYDGLLRARAPRETPAGTAAAAHRWRVYDRAQPDEPLCAGVAEDDLVLVPLGTAAEAAPRITAAASAQPALEPTDSLRALTLGVPLADSVYRAPSSLSHTVPSRVLATCAAVSEHLARGGTLDALAYAEELVPPETELHIAACVQRDAPAEPRDAPLPTLTSCPDGTPARVYLREIPVRARAQLRNVVVIAARGATLFSLVCVALGLIALRRAERDEG